MSRSWPEKTKLTTQPGDGLSRRTAGLQPSLKNVRQKIPPNRAATRNGQAGAIAHPPEIFANIKAFTYFT